MSPCLGIMSIRGLSYVSPPSLRRTETKGTKRTIRTSRTMRAITLRPSRWMNAGVSARSMSGVRRRRRLPAVCPQKVCFHDIYDAVIITHTLCIHTRSAFDIEDYDLSNLCNLPKSARCMVTCSGIVYGAGLEGVAISSSDCKAQCEAKEGDLCDGDDSGSSTDLASIMLQSISGAKSVSSFKSQPKPRRHHNEYDEYQRHFSDFKPIRNYGVRAGPEDTTNPYSPSTVYLIGGLIIFCLTVILALLCCAVFKDPLVRLVAVSRVKDADLE